MIGVDKNDFWLMQPKDLEPFNKAFLLSKELDMELSDIRNWQLGQYIRLAIGSVMDSKNKYPDKPLFYNNSDSSDSSEMDYEVGKRNNLIVKQKLLQRIRNRNKSSGGE